MARTFRRRRQNFRRARSFIRKTVSDMGPIVRKAIILDQVAIPARTSVAYDNPVQIHLLVAQEAENEETESNGTTIAEIKPYSRLVSAKMFFNVNGIGNQTRIRWMLIKDVDQDDIAGVTAAAILTDSIFHTTNDTPAQNLVRAHTLAKGMIWGTDRLSGSIRPFIKRQTLRRLSSFRENDRLTLLVATSEASASAIGGMGTLYLRPK